MILSSIEKKTCCKYLYWWYICMILHYCPCSNGRQGLIVRYVFSFSCLFGCFENFASLTWNQEMTNLWQPNGETRAIDPGPLVSQAKSLITSPPPLQWMRKCIQNCKPLQDENETECKPVHGTEWKPPRLSLRCWSIPVGAAVVEWLSSWPAEPEVRGSIPGLATWISKISYFLLPSPDMAEIPLKRRESSIQSTNQSQCHPRVIFVIKKEQKLIYLALVLQFFKW